MRDAFATVLNRPRIVPPEPKSSSPDPGVEESAALLRDLGILDATYECSDTSNITEGWGVEWSDDEIARDLLQNFYDANRENPDQVAVDASSPVVAVRAPIEYDLKKLYYLGSEKDPSTNIGQYGEGFKAAALCLVRDHRVRPVARAGTKIVCIRLSTAPVAGSLAALVYDWFSSTTYVSGNELLLKDCRDALRNAIASGMSHFLHPQNPLIGSRLWEPLDGAFGLFASATKDCGWVFYRGLRRAKVPDLPLVLVINKRYEQIEKLVRQDRDRKAFGEELLSKAYKRFAAAIYGNVVVERHVVEAARALWTRGHPLLAAVAAEHDRGRWGEWPSKVVEQVFGQRHFARAKNYPPEVHLALMHIERKWRDEGREPLPAYFSRFGVVNAQGHLEALEKASVDAGRRTPTSAERAAIEVMSDLLKDFAPPLHAVFERGDTTYSVAQSEKLLGALRQGRSFRSREVFLAAQLFEGAFATAFAVFIHEHAHVFGFDGSRGFTDALTEVLATMIQERHALDAAERRWEEVRVKVVQERHSAPAASAAHDAEIEGLSSSEIRELLRRLPPVTLRRLLDESTSEAHGR